MTVFAEFYKLLIQYITCYSILVICSKTLLICYNIFVIFRINILYFHVVLFNHNLIPHVKRACWICPSVSFLIKICSTAVRSIALFAFPLFSCISSFPLPELIQIFLFHGLLLCCIYMIAFLNIDRWYEMRKFPSTVSCLIWN